MHIIIVQLTSLTLSLSLSLKLSISYSSVEPIATSLLCWLQALHCWPFMGLVCWERERRSLSWANLFNIRLWFLVFDNSHFTLCALSKLLSHIIIIHTPLQRKAKTTKTHFWFFIWWIHRSNDLAQNLLKLLLALSRSPSSSTLVHSRFQEIANLLGKLFFLTKKASFLFCYSFCITWGFIVYNMVEKEVELLCLMVSWGDLYNWKVSIFQCEEVDLLDF